VNRDGALEVRQAEVVLAIAAIGRAEEGESAGFEPIGSSAPSQNAQPLGAKLYGTVRIWPSRE